MSAAQSRRGAAGKFPYLGIVGTGELVRGTERCCRPIRSVKATTGSGAQSGLETADPAACQDNQLMSGARRTPCVDARLAALSPQATARSREASDAGDYIKVSEPPAPKTGVGLELEQRRIEKDVSMPGRSFPRDS